MSQPPTPPSIRAACEKIISLMADYLSGALDPDLETRFERHLSQCQECLAYVNTNRQTISLMHNLHPEELDEAMQSRVWELICYQQQLAAIYQDLLTNHYDSEPRSDS